MALWLKSLNASAAYILDAIAKANVVIATMESGRTEPKLEKLLSVTVGPFVGGGACDVLAILSTQAFPAVTNLIKL